MTHSDEEIKAAEERLVARLANDTFELHEINELRAIADAAKAVEAASALLRERVQLARARGYSWNRIAIPLGVSRQAARQRFGGPDEEPSITPANDLMAALEQSLAQIRQHDEHAERLVEQLRQRDE